MVKAKTKGKQSGEDGARVVEEEAERREMAELLVLASPSESLQNGAGFSGKT